MRIRNPRTYWTKARHHLLH